MSSLLHLLTRGQFDPAARRDGGPLHRVRLEVWELEARVVPAGDLGAPAQPPLGADRIDAELPIRIPSNALGLPPKLMALPLVASSPHTGGPPVVVFADPL